MHYCCFLEFKFIFHLFLRNPIFYGFLIDHAMVKDNCQKYSKVIRLNMAIKVTYRISVRAKRELESYKYTNLFHIYLFKFLLRSSCMVQLAREVKRLSSANLLIIYQLHLHFTPKVIATKRFIVYRSYS